MIPYTPIDQQGSAKGDAGALAGVLQTPSRGVIGVLIGGKTGVHTPITGGLGGV